MVDSMPPMVTFERHMVETLHPVGITLCILLQAVIVVYNGSNCIARGTPSYSSTSFRSTTSIVYSSHHQLSVSARGAVPAEEYCLRG